MDDEELKTALHAALLRLKETPREQRHVRMGICLMVAEFIDKEWLCYGKGVRLDHMLCSLFKQWPDGTRCPGYPVPSTTAGIWEGDAYYRSQERGALWQGEYGDKRCALLNWLIEQTKE